MDKESNENNYDEKTVDVLLDEARKERTEMLGMIENAKNRIMSFTHFQPLLLGLYVTTFIYILENHSISNLTAASLAFALGFVLVGIIVSLMALTPLPYRYFSNIPEALYERIDKEPLKTKHELLQNYLVQQRYIRDIQKFYPKALVLIIAIIMLSMMGYVVFAFLVFWDMNYVFHVYAICSVIVFSNKLPPCVKKYYALSTRSNKLPEEEA